VTGDHCWLQRTKCKTSGAWVLAASCSSFPTLVVGHHTIQQGPSILKCAHHCLVHGYPHNAEKPNLQRVQQCSFRWQARHDHCSTAMDSDQHLMTGMATHIKSDLIRDGLQTCCLFFTLHTMNALGEQLEQADVPETV